MSDEQGIPADDGIRVQNSAADVHGAVVQAGHIGGDVIVQMPWGSPRSGDVPVVVTVDRLEDQAYVEFSDEPGVTHAWSGGLAILVEGCDIQAVVLKALRPVVLARRAPRSPEHVDVRRAMLSPRPFRIDLDQPVPGLVAAGPDFPFTVTASDPEQFRVDLMLSNSAVDWHLELDWTCRGRTGTVRIPGDGHFTHYPIR